eukprot:g29928.t1
MEGNESDNVYVSAVMVKIMSVAQREEKVQLARSLLRVPGLLRKMGTTRHGHQAAKKVLKTLTGSEHEERAGPALSMTVTGFNFMATAVKLLPSPVAKLQACADRRPEGPN